MRQIYPLEILQGFSSTGSFILMMTEPKSNQGIPILIGETEAQSIIVALEHVETRRPMTHTLLSNILEVFHIELSKVVVERFEEGIYYAALYLDDGFMEKKIDSRTSDAVVLALLQQCPIYVEDNVFLETAIPSDSFDSHKGEISSEADTPRHETQETIEELERRLEECEQREDYEEAAKIMETIKKLSENL